MAFARSLQFAEHTDSGDRAGASPPAFEFQGLDQRRGERQIDLLSLEEKIDTSSAAGELVFRVFGAIAHFERRLISERTKDGVAAARAKARQPGRNRSTCKRSRPPSS
ncbi:recombinase family protein [Mesorhizobium sp. M1005]